MRTLYYERVKVASRDISLCGTLNICVHIVTLLLITGSTELKYNLPILTLLTTYFVLLNISKKHCNAWLFLPYHIFEVTADMNH